MTDERLTAHAFHAAHGVDDWRVLFSGAHAFYRVGSFAEAARFVAAIADEAEAVGHFPDVDVLLHAHRQGLRIREVPVEMSAATRASSLHGGLATFYYPYKMLLALWATPPRVRSAGPAKEPSP